MQGFCYNHRQPEVYFACEGQTQCFKQGQNPAEHVWLQSSESPAPAFLQVCCTFEQLQQDNADTSLLVLALNLAVLWYTSITQIEVMCIASTIMLHLG